MFFVKFGDRVKSVTKIQTYTDYHRHIISNMRYDSEKLLFSDLNWDSFMLGSGEEKAVFCVHDQDNQVFAIEAIDERHYLNGRFVGGQYFDQIRIKSLSGVKARPDSEFGLMFSGLVKVREYVHGFEWARFQISPFYKHPLDIPLTAYLRFLFAGQFQSYRLHYKDVHDRNVMFEIRPWREKGVPMLVQNWNRRWQKVKVGLQPIDVR